VTHLLDTLLDPLLADPDQLAALAVAANRDEGTHLDDDAMAAILDGAGAADELVHAVRCNACRERLTDVASVLAVHDLAPAPAAAPDWLGTGVVLFASITASSDGDAVVETSGAARVHGALAVRASRGLAGLSLRDRRDHPSLEVSVLPAGRSTAFTLLVRWLADNGQRLAARVSSGGRTRAHMQMTGGSAMFTGLRRESVRIDVVDGDQRLATAWIGVTP